MICRGSDGCTEPAAFIIRKFVQDGPGEFEERGIVYHTRACYGHIGPVIRDMGEPAYVELLDENTIRAGIRSEGVSKRLRRTMRRRMMRNGGTNA